MNIKNIALILVTLAAAIGIYFIRQNYLHDKKNNMVKSHAVKEPENVKIQSPSGCTGPSECNGGLCCAGICENSDGLCCNNIFYTYGSCCNDTYSNECQTCTTTFTAYGFCCNGNDYCGDGYVCCGESCIAAGHYCNQ